MGKENQSIRDAEGRAPGRWVFFVSLAVLMVLGLITACATPTPSPAVVKEKVVKEAEPFECQGGDKGEDLVCTTESLEDEFGDKVQVIVTVPWQGREVSVVKLPVSEEVREILLAAPAPFPIRRLLINFEVVDAESSEPLREFEPPFELQVEYTANHWESAREAGEDHPRLAFWDFEKPEEEQKWVEFTPEKHDFRIEGDEEGGFLIATITDWGDPLHGGGP